MSALADAHRPGARAPLLLSRAGRYLRPYTLILPKLAFFGLFLAFPIGWAVSHLILALLFYGLFTPLAALLRLIGRDALHRKPRHGADSYYVPKTTPVDPGSYLRQY